MLIFIIYSWNCENSVGKGTINILIFTYETFDMCVNVDLCTHVIDSEIVLSMGSIELYQFKQTFTCALFQPKIKFVFYV